MAANLDKLAPAVGANSHLTVNAGGIGVWIAVTCLAVSMTANAFLGLLYLDHARKIDDLNTYLQAIYSLAPHLKPEK